MKLIDIQTIKVPADRRRLANTADLAGSMKEVGLICPISVTPDLILIAGLRRLEAAKLLGWTKIGAVVMQAIGMKAELAEIDENLVRNEPSALERADLLKRRKEIYEALHPETKAGIAGATSRHATDKLSVAETSKTKAPAAKPSVPSFAAETAKQTGITERSVRRDVKLATDLDHDAKETAKSSPIANNKSELQKLAKQKPETQRVVATAIATGKAKTVDQAIKDIPGFDAPAPAAKPSAPSTPVEPWTEFNGSVEKLAEKLDSMALELGRVLEVKKDNSKGKWSYFLSYQSTVLAVRSVANNLRENLPAAKSDKAPGYIPARQAKMHAAVRGGGK